MAYLEGGVAHDRVVFVECSLVVVLLLLNKFNNTMRKRLGIVGTTSDNIHSWSRGRRNRRSRGSRNRREERERVS